jgi:NADH-ubiquinone oxidoreductase chain 5
MVLSILTLPFAGAVAAGLFGTWMGAAAAGGLATVCLLVSLVLALIMFHDVVLAGATIHMDLGTWFASGLVDVRWSLHVDRLAATMTATVLLVSAAVHAYSMYYMDGQPDVPRFFMLIGLFTAGMLLLVLGGDYAILFIGWEAIGLASFLLVSYWTTRTAAIQSGLQALLMNRVGDAFLTAALIILLNALGSLDMGVVLGTAPSMPIQTITIVAACFVVAASAKSAQLGNHMWLPNAMEAPTPVSALLHAATLVTAGVYLLVRSQALVACSTPVLLAIVVLGASTALFASAVGIFQADMKRVIAYSTGAQLGYMVFAVGLQAADTALFHLAAHAFLKALLFLAAGMVLHAMADDQDMRRAGALAVMAPEVYAAFATGSLSLVGAPFTSGFESKDLLLEISAGTYAVHLGDLAHTIGLLAAAGTAIYSANAIAVVFAGPAQSRQIALAQFGAPAIGTLLSIAWLDVLAVVFGYLAEDAGAGLGVSGDAALLDTEMGLPVLIRQLPTVIVALAAGIVLFRVLHRQVATIAGWTQFLSAKGGFDAAYTGLVLRGGLALAYAISKHLERGILEAVGPYGATIRTLETALGSVALDVRSEAVASIARYATVTVCGVAVVLLLGESAAVLVLALLVAVPMFAL